MSIRGSGKDPREDFAKLIAPIEAQLKALSEINVDGALPTKKHDVRQAIGLLDQQISLVNAYAQSADGEIRGLAVSLLGKLQARRLQIEDPIFAAYFEKLVTKYGGPNPDGQARHLENKELATFLALAGDHLSDAEFHALSMLEPLLTAEQRERWVKPIQISSHQAERARTANTSVNRLWAEGSVIAPVALPIATSLTLSALEVVTGPFAAVLSIGGMAVGLDVGKYLQMDAQMAVNDYGVNRIEGAEVDRELVRLRERVEAFSIDPRAPLAETQDKLRREASVFHELLALRGGAAGEYETWVVDMFRWYATELERAGQTENPAARVRDLRREVLNKISKWDLDNVPSRIPMPAVLADQSNVSVAVDRLVREHNKVLLGLTHPSLLRFATHLDAKYGIEARVKDGGDGARLTGAEINGIRALVGKEPSLAEFIALHRLEEAKLLDVFDVWGQDLHVRLPNGSKLGGDNLKLLMDTLGGRAQASTLEAIGTNLPRGVLYGSAIGGAALAFALASNPIGWLAAGGLLLVARLTGYKLGKVLAETGRENKLIAGVEAASGRPVGSEHAMLLEKLADPRELLKGDAHELREKLKDEAELCNTLSASVKTTLDKAQQAIASAQGNPTATAEAIKTLAKYVPLQESIYSHITEFATMLNQVADSGADAATMRTRFFEARAKLFDPMVGYEVAKDVISQQIVPEKPVQVARYGVALERFLDSVAAFVVSNEAQPHKNYLALLSAARDVDDAKKLVPKKQKEAIQVPQAVETALSAVLKDPYAKPDLRKLTPVSSRAEEIKGDINKQFAKAEAIPEDRAKTVGQQVLNAWWTQIYPLFGTVSPAREDLIPQLRKISASMDEDNDWLVKGELKHGGTFSIFMNAFGEPNLDSMKLDLGERRIAAMAVDVLRSQLESQGVKLDNWAADYAKVESGTYGVDLANYGIDKVYQVQVPAGKSTYSVLMTPDGFALLDSLRQV